MCRHQKGRLGLQTQVQAVTSPLIFLIYLFMTNIMVATKLRLVMVQVWRLLILVQLTFIKIQKKYQLNHILRCPSISANLLSVHQFSHDNHCYFVFNGDDFFVKDNATGKTLFHGKSENGIYPFHFPSTVSHHKSFAFIGTCVPSQVWHQRLGHPSHLILENLVSSNYLSVKGSVKNKEFCDFCPLGKSTRLPFFLSKSVSSKPLQLVHSDVWTSPTYSIKGSKYYILFVDDYSKYTWLFPMRFKHEALDFFIKFKTNVENIFSSSIKYLQTDGGGEYLSGKFQNFLSQNGISHRLSCPHHPEQNGVSERKHRHVVDMGLTLLATAGIPSEFWVDAFNTSVYLINRLPTKQLNYISPYEKLFGKAPDYTSLRVFGCSCYPYLRPYNKHKLEFRSKQCVFLGYSLHHQGYRCYDIDNGRVYLSRHVIFNENVFPFKSKQNTSFSLSPTEATSPVLLTPPLTHPVDTLAGDIELSSFMPTANQPATSTEVIEPVSSSNVHSVGNSSLPQAQSFEPAPITVGPTTSTHPMVTRTRSGIKKPNPKYALTVAPTTTHIEPSCFSQAVKHAEWRLAMCSEFNALQKAGTWSLVPLSSNMHVLPNKWVYKVKHKSDGSVERFKARLVANGFHQQEGLDYTETFSPVVKHTTIRVVLALALHNNWTIRQLDVQNAFLHGTLNEEVYMKQPKGFEDPNFPDHVCRLHKSIYGLKQAPRAWFQRFSNYLLELGFVESKADYSLFIYKANGVSLMLLIYVDDIIITGNDANHITGLIESLNKLFAMKDLGGLQYFLGLEAKFNKEGLYLTQTKYATDLLKRLQMEDAKPYSNPTTSGQKMTLFDGTPLDDPTEYRSVVGALQYLTLTRPDLAFAVNQVCQFMHCPTSVHWMAVKRILRYVKGSIDHGLLFQSGDLTLSAFSDSDYAGSPDDRRSTGGYCIYLGPNLISWSSKKQNTVSRSSTESEYRQLAHTAAEISWLRQLLRDLHICLVRPPLIWCDNISSISLASNPIFHARTKHLEVDYHYVREKVVNKELDVQYITTRDQVADIFTKGLSTSQFETLKYKLMVRSRTLSLRGCDKHTAAFAELQTA